MENDLIKAILNKPRPTVVRKITTQVPIPPLHSRAVISMGGTYYVLLKKQDTNIHALRFSSCFFQKADNPHNVTHGLHPLSRFGLGKNGIYEVENSPWISEFLDWNLKEGPGYNEYGLRGLKHIIVCTIDVVFELLVQTMQEIEVPESKLFDEFKQHLNYCEPAYIAQLTKS